MEQKTEIPGMYKVSEGVVINKDNESLQNYKKTKMKYKKIMNLDQEVASMKSDIEQIKSILMELVKR